MKKTLAAIVGLLVVVFILDLSIGSTSSTEGEIVGKIFVPAETTVTFDGDGNMSTWTDPAHWTIVVWEPNLGAREIRATVADGTIVKLGEWVVLNRRVGGITGIGWFPRLEVGR